MSALAELLADGGRWNAEYAGGLSNHLPMALIALDALGADDERLAAFAAAASHRLEPAPPRERWPDGEPWAARLGDGSAWPAYRDLFARWLDSEDAGDVLRQVLPTLLHGCAGAAFHGLIRTALAVRARHRGELGDALAYAAARWLDLGADDGGPSEAAAPRRRRDPAALVAELPLLPPGDGLIVDRLRRAAAAPAFDGIVARLAIDSRTLRRLAETAARAYAASGHFTVLHLVTSAHAMRLLLPFVDGEGAAERALAAYWRAYAAGWSASGAVLGAAPAAKPWPAIVAIAVASDDEHVVKLVFACRDEERAYGGSVWRRAASRAVAGAG